jgi:outer membrane lipoprotein-sorting protein
MVSALLKFGYLSLLLFCISFSNAYADITEAAEEYLSELESMAANFSQTDPNGVVSTGKFFLKRPKQMRWQYSPPTPILMVTRGDFLTYYDYELEQVSDIPLDNTLLSVLSKKEIDFSDEEIEVIDQEEDKESEEASVTLIQKGSAETGQLKLIFEASPLRLKGLQVVDATGQETKIELSDIQENIELEDEVFTFRDPRTGGKNKKYKDK